MLKRPKRGEDEDDILRMQEEYLREKSKNQDLRPAAQITNLRLVEPTKRSIASDSGTRKPSKYAQSKGLKNHSEKRPRTEEVSSSVMGDILEKNLDENPPEENISQEDDKIYFPKLIPSLLGNIVEKNLDEFVDLSIPMPVQGFPVATKRDSNLKPSNKSIHAQEVEKRAPKPSQMEVDQPTTSTTNISELNYTKNLPNKSYILSSKDATDIHKENLKVLGQMSEKEILDEQKKLLATIDPNLIAFIKSRREKGGNKADVQMEKIKTKPKLDEEPMETVVEPQPLIDNTLWDNDILSNPNVNKWLHFDSLEKDKLEWIKGIEESKKVNPDQPYEARFNFNGYLLPYSMEYTEENKTLFHHGDEPERPGYTLAELFELSRSTITQQRVMALNTIAGVLEYYSAGAYKDIIEIPLSKIFFIIRFALDENIVIILEPALKAMRNLIFNRIDEACLDALIGFEEGTQQPCLENDKSEIEELESKESELKDFHLAEIDIVAALLRTDILQRLYYILKTVKPSFNCVQYSLQILTRLARDSLETSTKIVEMNYLMKTIIRNFVPVTGINFAFDPQIVYNGKPVLAALKFLRVLSLQSPEISEVLTSKYDLLHPISEYISSGVDGTYGLRIQIEAYCILSNLLHFYVGIENATSICPIIITTLYKHVQGTDIFANSSVISATHAAIVLQFVNKLLNCNMINLDSYKQQIYPLIKEGVQKWLTQLSRADYFTCAHLRLLCAALDCCRMILISEQLVIKFLNDSLKIFAASSGFKEVIKNLIPSSNLLSGIENKNIHLVKNLMSLGGSIVDSSHKVLPVLNVTSPLPFLASLFHLLVLINDPEISRLYLENVSQYMKRIVNKIPSLCDNWFTRIESDLVFYIVMLANQSTVSESEKDIIYAVTNKLCYILRTDKKNELEYIFNNILFNKDWFTAERLLSIVSLSDSDNFSKTLASVDEIKQCYCKVINLNYKDTGPNIALRKWQEPILPRDWIYLPILTLYSNSQKMEPPAIVGEHAKRVAKQIAEEKEMIIRCCLEWILFNELCFPDLLNDIDITDRFCRIMCVFLCDNALFLEPKINFLIHKCTQVLFKKKRLFNFDKHLVGLHNFQDFYTQLLEQFQSVSYGDHTFASCVLVPLAQKHNVKWRKLLWSEYAGCLRALDCQENMLCYDLNDYYYPEETDESLIKSYFRALSTNLLRSGTIAYKIAQHHVQIFKSRNENK